MARKLLPQRRTVFDSDQTTLLVIGGHAAINCHRGGQDLHTEFSSEKLFHVLTARQLQPKWSLVRFCFKLELKKRTAQTLQGDEFRGHLNHRVLSWQAQRVAVR